MSDYTVGDTCHFMFTTRRFSTGAPFALAGTPVVSAYENESLTQITAGITLGVDHDTVTGLNLLTVVASGANGFESGKDYHLVITTGTVDSVSVVGEVVGRFTLSRSAAAVDLANGTDGLGAIKADTAATLVDTADMQPKLGTPAGASISADIATANAAAVVIDNYIDTEIADIQARLPAALTADGNIKADILRISGSATAADNLEASALGIEASSVNDAAASTTAFVTALGSAVNDHYIGRIIVFTSGTLANQATDITDYVGATKTVTVTALTSAPANGVTFVVV